jgi:cysteine-rich repeat protein
MRTTSQLAAIWIAAALTACSVDAVTFTLGDDQPAENCAAPGDEDGNGVADCSDPACASAPACQAACGNGKLEAAEVCDDGNRLDGDGCDNTCKGTGSGIYEAIADAMIRTGATAGDAGTSFGGALELSTYGSSFGAVARSLIAFDVTAIAAGSHLRSAYLGVRMVDQAGVSFSIDVHEVSSPWSEASVTWNSQPELGSAVEASLAYQGYTWWRFDVTALVQRWVNAASAGNGLALVQNPEQIASGGEFAIFRARESPDRPYLEIVVGP